MHTLFSSKGAGASLAHRRTKSPMISKRISAGKSVNQVLTARTCGDDSFPREVVTVTP